MSIASTLLSATVATAPVASQGQPDIVGLFRHVCIGQLPLFAESGSALEQVGFAPGPVLANGARAYATTDRVYFGMIDRNVVRGPDRAQICSLGMLGPRASAFERIEPGLAEAVASRAGDEAEHQCVGEPAAEATCLWSWSGPNGCEGVQAQIERGRVIGLIAVASSATADCAEAVR